MRKLILSAAVATGLISNAYASDELDLTYGTAVQSIAFLEALKAACGVSDPAPKIKLLALMSGVSGVNMSAVENQIDAAIEAEKGRTGSTCFAETSDQISRSEKSFRLQLELLEEAIKRRT